MVLDEICDLCSEVNRMNNKYALQYSATSTGKPEIYLQLNLKLSLWKLWKPTGK